MIEFSNYLIEAANDPQPNTQTHLQHPNYLIFPPSEKSGLEPHEGHTGVGQSFKALTDFYNHLSGKKRNVPTSVSTKMDGAPAVHIGKDETGRYFVATKSMFNKNPKINYTEQDIDDNHGHAPGLAGSLKDVLKHAHKMIPSDAKPGEVYKGDLLFGGDRPLSNNGDGSVSYHPNLLKYSYPENSEHGTKASNAKIGFAMHTFYGKDGNAVPLSSKQRSKIPDHPDVFQYNPEFSVNPEHFSPEDHKNYQERMQNAQDAYSKIKPDFYDSISKHGDLMQIFMNSRVRTGQGNDGAGVEDYKQFLTDRANKDISKLKTESGRARKAAYHAGLMQQITGNEKGVQNLFDLHHHLNHAKNTLVDVSNRNSPETVSLPNGSSTHHEGYVSAHTDDDGNPFTVKMVNQGGDGFASHNLAGQGNIQQQRTPQAVQEGFNPFGRKKPDGSDHKVIAFIRANPITRGHETLINKVKEVASNLGARHKVIFSHSQDAKKNPLSVAEKLHFAKHAFPGVNFGSSSRERPDLLSHLSDLHAKGGTRNVTIVGGSDRKTMAELANKYNGVEGRHGYYNFDSINFEQVGEERGDSNPVSGTAARDTIKKGDKAGFINNFAPVKMSADKATEMYHAVRKGMGLDQPKMNTESYLVNLLKSRLL